MGEEVAAEQGAGCLVVEVAGFPAVRQVRGVDPPESVSADVEHVTVGEWSRFSVSDVADGDHAAGGAGHGGGVGGGGEPLVERAALVGLDVTEADPSQSCEWGHGRHSIGDRGEEGAEPGVEQQWFLAEDEVLVEAEVDLVEVGRELVDAVGDLGGAYIVHLLTVAPIVSVSIGGVPYSGEEVDG